jgi:WD40 repeat protein
LPPLLANQTDKLQLNKQGDRLALWLSGSHGASLFAVDSGETINLRLPDKTSETADLTFSTDGTRVAVAGRDDIRIFRADDGAPIGRPLIGHQTPLDSPTGVLSVVFSPNGQLLLTTGLDGTTRLWTAATGKEQYVLPGTAAVTFSPDGGVFAAVRRTGLVIRSISSGKQLLSLPEITTPVTFSPDGSQIVADDGSSVRVFACDVCGSLEHLQTLVRHRLGKD